MTIKINSSDPRSNRLIEIYAKHGIPCEVVNEPINTKARVINPRTAPGFAVSLSVSFLIIIGLIVWFAPWVGLTIGFIAWCTCNSNSQPTPISKEQLFSDLGITDESDTDEWSNEVEQVQFTYTQSAPQVFLLQSAPSVDNLTVMSYKELTEIANRYHVPVKRAKRDMIKSLVSVLS